ncbi:protein lethal(2)essential for life-like [Ostrinia nubilalis]|uniref:protein lethal(2)essential for life-like n=1 Tax=Ostrinia nubilalis TaxID=29057 RepID=UPI0030823558
MSLLPYVLGLDVPHVPRRPIHHPLLPASRLLDQDFGLALGPDDLLTAVVAPSLSSEYYRPWRHLSNAVRDMGSSIKVEKDKFQINLDVQHFLPEEISVKTADGYIVVEGKHEEKKDDHGFVSRSFTRRYALPEGTHPETVESKLSSDGVLTITAPKKVSDVSKAERPVPIAKTGPVRKEIKDRTVPDEPKEEEK